jgi:hypothetical protein
MSQNPTISSILVDIIYKHFLLAFGTKLQIPVLLVTICIGTMLVLTGADIIGLAMP